jgi:hypothetical protein
MSTNIAEYADVTRVLTERRLGQYANSLFNHLNQNGLDRASLEEFVRAQGGDPSSYSVVITDVLEALRTVGSTTTPQVSGVESALAKHGLGRYASIVEVAITLNGLSRATLEGVVRQQGGDPSTFSHAIDSVLADLSQPTNDEHNLTVGEGSAFVVSGTIEGFDRETACAVIRAFIEEGENPEADYTAEEVTALLVLAGLEDEVVPEPEVDDEAGSDLATMIREAVAAAVAPLVEFARRHGYRG